MKLSGPDGVPPPERNLTVQFLVTVVLSFRTSYIEAEPLFDSLKDCAAVDEDKMPAVVPLNVGTLLNTPTPDSKFASEIKDAFGVEANFAFKAPHSDVYPSSYPRAHMPTPPMFLVLTESYFFARLNE